MVRVRLIAVFLMVGVLSAYAVAADGTMRHVGRTIAPFRLQDYLGTWHELGDFADSKAVVITFLGVECPLSKLYGARLAEVAERFADRDVTFIGIDSNQQDTPTEIAHFARVHNIGYLLLKDPGNRVADEFEAERTPELFLLDSSRIVRYWGRIDDQFGVGYARPRATENYLVTALDSLLAGKPVRPAEMDPVGCFIGRVYRDTPHGDITYSRQVSRILQRRCVSCHRTGGIAPFSLGSYNEVAGWAETIREVIQDQRMPPWHANPKYGRFSNDARMPDQEKQQVYQWVENGVPEGDPAELPPKREFVEDWRIGAPDMVVGMSDTFTVPATGVVPYQYVVMDPGLTEDKWVRASEAIPGNRGVVHHILAFIQPPGTQFDPDRLGIGFEMLGGYVPGMPPMVLPDGTARLLPAGSKIVFQLHYTPNGSQQVDRSRLGLAFADPETVNKTMQMGAAVNAEFRIPAGADNHRVDASSQISHDTLLYSLTPHMHYRGKSFRYEAVYPNGAREVLLDVPRYDFNWQHIYYLSEPKYLPAGTLMNCIAHFDNSADNLSNPDPTVSVRWGEQTWEEMMIGYYEGVLVNQDLTLPQPQIAPAGDDQYDVLFTYAPNRPARTVHLAGTFNEWNTASHPLKGPDDKGQYKVRLRLAEGTYRYKFVVDGRYWTHDPASGRLIGVLHESLLVVGDPPTQ